MGRRAGYGLSRLSECNLQRTSRLTWVDRYLSIYILVCLINNFSKERNKVIEIIGLHPSLTPVIEKIVFNTITLRQPASSPQTGYCLIHACSCHAHTDFHAAR